MGEAELEVLGMGGVEIGVGGWGRGTCVEQRLAALCTFFFFLWVLSVLTGWPVLSPGGRYAGSVPAPGTSAFLTSSLVLWFASSLIPLGKKKETNKNVIT